MEFKASGINDSKVREKVPVKPGFHLIDWNRLLRSMSAAAFGVQTIKVTEEELAQHNSKYDCWVAYKGKVYNITQYLPYHPGGEQILLECGGTDCTELFDEHHKWVNVQAMVGKFMVGVLETSSQAETKSDVGSTSDQKSSDAKSELTEKS